MKTPNFNTKLQKSEWYELLVEECKAIIVETEFISRLEYARGKWLLGERISNDQNFKKIQGQKNKTSFIDQVSKDINIHRSDVSRSVQFYEKYPEDDFVTVVTRLPWGKALSWNKIRGLLPESKEKELPVVDVPKGKYSTIVIDPPWDMKFMVLEMRPNQTKMPYPTMTIDEIKEFPINNISADNCNLFLWTTHKYLPDAFDILDAWRFKYHVCLTWDKTNGRSLFGFNRRTELVLYAHKGKITVNQRGNFIDTIFTEKLREHSRKPDIFYEIIKNNTPEPRIDIFSREKRDGFEQWGNEEDKFNG